MLSFSGMQIYFKPLVSIWQLWDTATCACPTGSKTLTPKPVIHTLSTTFFEILEQLGVKGKTALTQL